MRILHTSDLHIGKKLYSSDRIEEQKAFLQELSKVCEEEQIDIVLIAGDLFDTFNPSTASMKLLYDSLCDISKGGKRPVVAIAGNHDSADRIDMPDSFSQRNGIFFIGNYGSYQEPIRLNSSVSLEKSASNYLQFRFSKYDYPLQLLVTPFVNEQRLKEKFNSEQEEQALRDYLQNVWQQTLSSQAKEDGVKILMSHLFVLENENDERTEPEDENAINIGGASAIYSENIPEEIQYTALGHLHRCQKVGKREIWYSGSPLAYSFSEDEQDKYFLIVDIEPNEKPIVRKRKIESGMPIKNLLAYNVEEALRVLKANQNNWVQLRFVNNKALSYEETTMLHSAHNHLLQIIPEIQSTSERSEQRSRILEMQDNPLELFKEFYKHTHAGQEPDDMLTNLFQEVINYKNETN